MRNLKIDFAFLLFFVLCWKLGYSQEKTDKASLQFSGYVKTDIYYDTRQMETMREGHMSLYPKAPSYDVNNKDVNAAPSLNFQAIQTRFRTDFKTPGIWNATISGAIEAEFFGVSNSDVNSVRMRHAYGKMNWKHSELLVGQYWHPFFVTECFANTQSFNAGIPFQPFARNPQIRYTLGFHNFKVIGALMSERDYPSIGPKGASNEYQRNSGIPMSDLQIQFSADSGRILLGAGVDYKQIRPELSTSATYVTTEKVNALSFAAFLKYEVPKFYWRLHTSMLENSYDMVGIGGYAATYIDPDTKIATYTPLRTGNFWSDIQYQYQNMKFGLFAGYSKNLGTKETILISSITSREKGMDDLYRISPRAVYQKNKVSLGLELEYTVASFGTPYDKCDVHNTTTVANLRTLFTVFYYFNQ